MIRRFYAGESTDHLLGRLARRKVDVARERHNDRVRRETDATVDQSGGAHGDARGVPLIGYGIGGTMKGTQPEQETVRKLTPRDE